MFPPQLGTRQAGDSIRPGAVALQWTGFNGPNFPSQNPKPSSPSGGSVGNTEIESSANPLSDKSRQIQSVRQVKRGLLHLISVHHRRPANARNVE